MKFLYLCLKCGYEWRDKRQTMQCPNCHEPALPQARS